MREIVEAGLSDGIGARRENQAELYMNDKKRPKLVTWKHTVLVIVALGLAIAFTLYRDYEAKGYLDRSDLVTHFCLLAPVIIIAVGLGYWANRRNGKK
ncbi:MAG: hypothetical protein ACYSSO_03520 [Planctomycetota bacterium]